MHSGRPFGLPQCFLYSLVDVCPDAELLRAVDGGEDAAQQSKAMLGDTDAGNVAFLVAAQVDIGHAMRLEPLRMACSL